MKVHIIEADLTGKTISHAVGERDKLGRQIAALAKQVNEPVLFHDYVGDLGGAPVILLECSDRFLASVRTLAGYKTDREVRPGVATERSPRVQKYFMSGGKPDSGPDCKIIPPRRKPPTP